MIVPDHGDTTVPVEGAIVAHIERAVVDDDDLKILIGLRRDAGERHLQAIRPVVGRHNDRDHRRACKRGTGEAPDADRPRFDKWEPGSVWKNPPGGRGDISQRRKFAVDPFQASSQNPWLVKMSRSCASVTQSSTG